MADFDLGTAWIQITPSMKGFSEAVRTELGGVPTDRYAKSWSASIKGALSGAFKTVASVGTAALGTIGAVIGGLTVKGGIDRALAIEGAEAKLKGLGKSAAEVEGIMDNALASVKGTAFGLGDAATVAASLNAAGVQQGAELEKTLKSVADTAQLSGRSLTDVGAIFGSVAARGKLQGDDLLQLTSAGVPVLQFLSKQLGKTSAEISEMVSRGEIDFATFQAAMESGIGGAALAAGDTFTGAWANVKAAFGRGGAILMTPVIDGLRQVFVALAPAIDKVVAALEPFAGAIGERVSVMAGNIAGALERFEFSGPVKGVQGLSTLAPVIGSLSGVLGPLLAKIPLVGGAFSSLTGPVGLVIGLFTQMFIESGTLRDAIGNVFATLGQVGQAAAPIMETLMVLVAGLAGALGDTLGEAINAVLPIILELVQGVLPIVLDALNTLIDAALPVVQEVLAEVTPLLKDVLAAIMPIIQAIGPMLKPALDAIIAVVKPILGLISKLIKPLTKIAKFVLDLITPILQLGAAILQLGIEWLAGIINDVLAPAIEFISDIIAGFIGWITDLGDANTEAGNGIQSVWGGIGAFFKGIWDAVAAAFKWVYETVIKPVVDGISWLVTNVLMPPFQQFMAVVKFVWDAVTTATKIFWAAISAVFNAVVGFVRDVLGAVFKWFYESVIKPVWDGIKFAIQLVWVAIKGYFEAWKWVIENVLAPVFKWLYETIVKPVWDGIKSAIGAVGSWFENTLAPIFNGALDVIGRGFEGFKKTVETVWNAVKTAAMAPVRFVVYTVYRDGIKALFDGIAKGLGMDLRMPDPPSLEFASGGVLPGYTPGRDVHRFYSPTAGFLHLSGGEGIIRPDALRALGGKRWLDRVNRERGSATPFQMFKDGGVYGGVPSQSFFLGGFFDFLGDTVANVTKFFQDAAAVISEVISDPVGAITKYIVDPVKEVVANIGGGTFGQILTGIPFKVIDGIIKTVKDFLAPEGVTGAGLAAMGPVTFQGYHGGPTLRRLIPIIKQFGLTVTDTYGSPAYNASLGRSPTSYHGDAANPAVDMAGPYTAMSLAADKIIAMGGWRQILWQTAGHWDHIHVAREGGVFGDLPVRKYDAGGWLQPGYTLAVNETGRPEPILTADQWESMHKPGITINQHNLMPVADPNVIGDRLAAAAARGLIGVGA